MNANQTNACILCGKCAEPADENVTVCGTCVCDIAEIALCRSTNELAQIWDVDTPKPGAALGREEPGARFKSMVLGLAGRSAECVERGTLRLELARAFLEMDYRESAVREAALAAILTGKTNEDQGRRCATILMSPKVCYGDSLEDLARRLRPALVALARSTG